ncbi:hypothetical protein KQX54_006929 [Cotesia glomerata]|uniref:Uncharacterized protein n=1 Tax=Cotesia glomerata TaxID=32391 RepID=A0AAV7I7N9_COTGL|nr:hypothetical protein KQX54_006929 [Cotesia glomerata]
MEIIVYNLSRTKAVVSLDLSLNTYGQTITHLSLEYQVLYEEYSLLYTANNTSTETTCHRVSISGIPVQLMSATPLSGAVNSWLLFLFHSAVGLGLTNPTLIPQNSSNHQLYHPFPYSLTIEQSGHNAHTYCSPTCVTAGAEREYFTRLCPY